MSDEELNEEQEVEWEDLDETEQLHMALLATGQALALVVGQHPRYRDVAVQYLEALEAGNIELVAQIGVDLCDVLASKVAH